MFNQLAAELEPGSEGARRRLQELEGREEEFKDIQRLLRDEVEATLSKGRR